MDGEDWEGGEAFGLRYVGDDENQPRLAGRWAGISCGFER